MPEVPGPAKARRPRRTRRLRWSASAPLRIITTCTQRLRAKLKVAAGDLDELLHGRAIGIGHAAHAARRRIGRVALGAAVSRLEQPVEAARQKRGRAGKRRKCQREREGKMARRAICGAQTRLCMRANSQRVPIAVPPHQPFR